jgi:Bacterial PH domain/Short C-terminal domain
MDFTFSAFGTKKWTIHESSIVIDKTEFQFSELDSVKLFSKASKFTNGVIQLTINGKVKTLAFPNSQKAEGMSAFEELQNNCQKKVAKQLQKNRGTFARSPEEINTEIKALPTMDDWFTRKEIAELPNILHKDEHIKAITSGFNDGNTWLITCTTKRIIMMDKGMIYGLKVAEIPLDRINSITHSTGLVLGQIAITDGAVTRQISNINKNTVKYFVDAVNSEIDKIRKLNFGSTQVVQQVSAADEIVKFKSLLDSGIITQEEFEIKKKSLLGL